MTHEKYESLLVELHTAYPFLTKGAVPLSLGVGKEIRELLLNAGYSDDDATTFLNEYFSRTEYLVAIINAIDDPNRSRFNLDGTVSDSKVSDRDLLAVAFNRNVYTSDLISKAARTYSRKMQGRSVKEKGLLQYRVKRLCELGFTHAFILKKVGKKAAPYLIECNWSRFKDEDVQMAVKLSAQAEHLSRREIRAFQRNMMDKKAPIALINLASGNNQDYIYATLYEHADVDRTPKHKLKSKQSHKKR